MVIGAGSESYRTVRYLVERLPAMIAPAWLRNRTQPIAIDDVLEYLVQAAERPEVAAGEVQIGGPDVLTYSDVLALMADVLGKRRRPQMPVPFITPRLSSLWIGLVTPVDAGVARPLIESLASETIVTDPEPAAAVRRAADRLPGGASPHASGGAGGRRRHAVRPVELRATTASLTLAEAFGIARGSRTTQSVVQVELEHDGVVGRGEAAPVYYRGESVESAADFLDHRRAAARGRRPVRARGHRGAARGRGRRGGRQGRARRRAPRLDRQAARRAALAAARPLAGRARPPRTRSASTRSRARATAPAGRASSAR